MKNKSTNTNFYITDTGRNMETQGQLQVDVMPQELLDCTACAEVKAVHEFPSTYLSNGCEHMPSVCLECMALYLAAQVDVQDPNQIVCPECPEYIGIDNLQQYMDKDTFAR